MNTDFNRLENCRYATHCGSWREISCTECPIGKFLEEWPKERDEYAREAWSNGIKPGDRIHTPRFLHVTIEEVLTPEEAKVKGYKVSTDFEHPDFDIRGCSYKANHMRFAAILKDKPQG